MTFRPVIREAAYCLAHAPGLVRYGSKPYREIVKAPGYAERLTALLRPFESAARYPPNRTFLGGLAPDALARIARPWHTADDETPDTARGQARFGEIIPEATLLGLLEQADVLEPPLVAMADSGAADSLRGDAVLGALARRRGEPVTIERLREESNTDRALALTLDGRLRGIVRRDDRAEGREDANLDARTLLEGLSTKATAAAALQWLLERADLGPDAIDYIISCGEEAAGDRYQRGGGGMAKAVGEMCGCTNASGMDIKNFCAAPASALVTAAALVAAGLYERVAVVAGGSLAKLGMKSEAFIEHGIPILDDVLASHAFLVTRDDGSSPVMLLEPGAVGMASIGSSTADEAVYRELLLEPLESLGLTMGDIDKYAPELHNPEIMEHAGSGDVAHKNYRMIAAMAVRAGAIEKAAMQPFIDRVGMVGYAPTQGHIPSGVAYIGHALREIRAGTMKRVMILSKASLFLNRLTELYDGVSFVLQANPGRTD